MEHVKKLTRLEPHEKTEEALLRSRIDQQSELICILKRRADEYLEKCMQNEKDLTLLKQEKDKSEMLLLGEERKSSLLKSRFDKLDENHLELIKIKDEIKEKKQKFGQ